MMETGWLIERKDRAGWLAANWLGDWYWTSNRWQAVRFSRKLDAEAVIRSLVANEAKAFPHIEDFVATEHEWR